MNWSKAADAMIRKQRDAMMIHQTPAFDNERDLFAYIKPLPWRALRIYRLHGRWHAVAFSLSTNLTAKA